MEERIVRIEERISHMEERMTHMEEQMVRMGERIAHVEGIIEEMRKGLNHLRNDFRMLLWIQLGSWVTLMAAIITMIAIS